MRTSEQINEIAAALAEFQGADKKVEKNRTVKVRGKTKTGSDFEYNFKYATFDHIIEVTREPLRKEGLSFIQGVSHDENGLCVTTRLMHKSGQWMESTMPIYLGADRNPQAVGSAITYAKRYALTAMLGIAADEDDDANAAEGNQMEVRGRKEPAQPKKAAPAPSKEEPHHVKDARAIVLAAEKVKPDEWDAFFDGLGPRLADIKEASEATHEFVLKRLGEIEASMKVAA